MRTMATMRSIQIRNSCNGLYRAPVDIPRDGIITSAIARLRAPLRWIMILGQSNGFSTGEIASLAGTSHETIELMQDRGRSLIHRELLRRGYRSMPQINCGHDAAEETPSGDQWKSFCWCCGRWVLSPAQR